MPENTRELNGQRNCIETEEQMILLGVDTGGTFTDFIFKDGEQWKVFKQLSTPSNPAESVLTGLRHIAGEKSVHLVHGSTVATNAILERKGAVTALITNRGFEDIIEIGRQNRKSLYDLSYRKIPPLVPAALRFGLRCRIDHNGTIVDPLEEDEVRLLADQLKRLNVDSIAVSFLFAFNNPVHEQTVGAALSDLGVPISLSHRIISEFREFERTSTTIINAYVCPKMNAYLEQIAGRVGESNVRIMQSNGGSISAQTAMHESVRTILSGPAGGVVGAYEIGKIMGFKRLITFDMGGTSTDVALVDDDLPLTMESSIADQPVKVPMIDIHTVGAGGGSIAHMDTGGALKVGPKSAGADPGPICFGTGDQVTVTDANLYLGRLIPDQFLGGHMQLDAGRLDLYFKKMAKQTGLSPVELAEGILAIANTTMEKAIRVISVEKGIDPRQFALFSFGGAGGMHAVFLARLLNISTVFIPKNPGILSAVGMLLADIIKDYSQTVMVPVSAETLKTITASFDSLEQRGIDDLQAEGVEPDRITLDRYLDMRYRGQSYEIIVPFDDQIVEAFHLRHESMYGYSNRDKAVEIVNIRLRAIGGHDKPRFRQTPLTGNEPDADAVIGRRPVIFDGTAVDTRIVARDKLKNKNCIKGPAVLVEYSTTIVLPPDSSCRVDEYENLIVSTKG